MTIKYNEWILKSDNVVTDQGVTSAAIWIQDGKIQKITPPGQAPKNATILDAGALAILPGLVDTHVHINEPGRADWEGFESATRAALAGGVTTLVDMPLNSSPVTTTLESLDAKHASATGKLWADCGFWGGVVPGNQNELEPMIKAGALGFKAFLIDSGIDDFPKVDESSLNKAMLILARHGAPLLAHAELEGPLSMREGKVPNDKHRYAGYLFSRPESWEIEAIEILIRLCQKTGCRTHIVHLSSSEALESIARAKAQGSPITAETCPHYLIFSSEKIPDGATQFKCSPPIRDSENQNQLWQALKEGIVDFVVSDHSPCPAEMKLLDTGDFMRAWGGISSLQFGLSSIWTQSKNHEFDLCDIVRWMSERPARFAGLGTRKGRIAPGFDADLMIFDPKAAITIEPKMIHHHHKLTPYQGMRLKGQVRTVFLRGSKIYDQGIFNEPAGQIITSQKFS
ncbi:MAG: allantoinase AllB [Elusimicrobia bacterium]|nr:allantoinase AllB [Elusimicrobiota bacterium]